MGEISDALRRARIEPPPDRPAREPVRGPSEPDDDHRAALRGEATAPPPPGRKATLSTEKHEPWLSRAVVVDGRGAAAESFRHIALRLKRALDDRGARSFAVVSALREEGKTTIACNLALALASLAHGRNVALVDLDLRKPSVAAYLELPTGPGVDDVLRGSRRLDEVCIAIDRPALDIYPVWRSQHDAHEVLVQPVLEAMVQELERHYEVIVFDTPPVLLVPDAAVTVERLGGAVTVARAGRTSLRGFEQMLKLLPPGKVLGSILNDGSPPPRAHHYGYYGDPAAEADE